MSRRSIVKNIYKHTVFEGVIRGNRKGYAFLARSDGGEDMFIARDNLHGAQHGDTVQCRRLYSDDVEVVKVLRRGVSRLVGTLKVYRTGCFVLPDDDAYYSDIHIDALPEGALNDQKVVVDIVDYPKGANPEGVINRILGKAGEKESEVLATLYRFGFADVFPVEVTEAARSLAMTPPEEDRADLRKLLTITIDGDDARDFDDAISVSKTKGDGYELWVHIADVSHFVEEAGVIDEEAYQRATSVYFPRRAFPMLPEALSNNLCSLVPNEDRYCLSCRMRFTEHGERKDVYLTKSVIHSAYRMTYRKVQGILDGDETLCRQYESIVKMLSIAQDLARLLRAKRIERGAIDFSAHETTVLFDGDKIKGVVPALLTESNAIIEDFMIAANEAVASTLQRAGYPCAYRVHDVPEEDRLRTLTAFAECFGLAPEDRYLNEKEICDFVRACQDTPYADVISTVAIRCMQKAKYSPLNIGHYGLGSECYCHFTSPIRRYPDLMVHRLVKRYIANKGTPLAEEEVNAINEALEAQCMHCSMQERAAEKAERDIVRYYEAVYMQSHLGEQCSAVVSGVTARMMFATLPNGIEGGMLVEDMHDSFYYDPMRYRLVGQHSAYRIGDTVEVVVTESDPMSRRIRFDLVRKGHTIAEIGKVEHRRPPAGVHGSVRTRDHKAPKKRRRR
jgi:ribonuclease R